MSSKRLKTHVDDAFKRPHSSVEDLQASTRCLSHILDIVSAAFLYIKRSHADTL